MAVGEKASKMQLASKAAKKTSLLPLPNNYNSNNNNCSKSD
jgi:hypothetical protein